MVGSMMRFFGAAFLAWSSLAPATSVGRAGELPDLEVVATTTLRLSREHTQAYVKKLRLAARGCLDSLEIYGEEVADDEGGLFPRDGDGTQGKDAPNDKGARGSRDGAAQYRLVVAHAGEARIGTSPRRRSTDLAPITNPTQLVARDWNWYLDVHEKGAVTFRLLRWQGGGYQKIDEWSTPYQDSVRWLEATSKRTDHLRDRPNLSPAELAEARSQAVMNIMPNDSIEDSIMRHFVPVMVLDVGALELGEAPRDVTLLVANRSPWPLAKLRVLVRCKAPQSSKKKHRDVLDLELEISFPELLLPGQKKKVTERAKGKERSVYNKSEIPDRPKVTYSSIGLNRGASEAPDAPKQEK